MRFVFTSSVTSIETKHSAEFPIEKHVMPTGVWRSHFRGVSESVDPGGYANTTTNTSFLVREDDLLLTRGGTTDSDPGSDSDLAGSFMVAVGVNDIVTVSTRMEGVPSVAPTLPQSPPPCTFPRTLVDDFDNVTAGAKTNLNMQIQLIK